jgi:hypothetical protein
MIKSILIIEDNMNDIKWYRSLFNSDKEISLLFYNKNKDYSDEKFIDLLELLYEDLFKKIKRVFIYNETSEISEVIKNNNFDFYIFDSLEKLSQDLILNSGLAIEKVAILSSTSSFRRFMRERGYAVYRKADIDTLIQERIK